MLSCDEFEGHEVQAVLRGDGVANRRRYGHDALFMHHLWTNSLTFRAARSRIRSELKRS